MTVTPLLCTTFWRRPVCSKLESPDPYLDALDKYGLPRSESHNPALVD